MRVINEQIIPALDAVGQSFEQKTIFLPQLLMSAEAAKAAFDEVRKTMPAASSEGPAVILATVKGDIHDIGKNIVKVLLENYGYRVIDLGRDVPPEKVLETALENDIRLVGLSALMTTTVPAMEQTARPFAREKAGLQGSGRRRGADAGICGPDWRGSLRKKRDGDGAVCAAGSGRSGKGIALALQRMI